MSEWCAALWSHLSHTQQDILRSHLKVEVSGDADLEDLINNDTSVVPSQDLFLLVCAFIAEHPDQHRSLQSRILPALLKQVTFHDINLGMILWQVILEAELEGQVLLMSLLIRVFLPWAAEEQVDEQAFDTFAFDLRKQAELTEIIQSGLLDSNISVRKQSLYLLKQLVKWTSVKKDTEEIPHLNEDDPCRLFIWTLASEKVSWMETWSSFFLLYEAFGEPQSHLIDPMLPLLDQYLQVGARLGVNWWQLLMRRGFTNDSMAVRRKFLDYLLERDLQKVPRLRECLVFLLGPLLSLLDNASLFATGDLTIMVSQFGLRVSQFYAQLLKQYQANGSEATLLFLEQLQAKIHSPLPMIFLLQSLLLLPSAPWLNAKHLAYLLSISTNRAALHNRTARRLVRLLTLQIALHLADHNQLGYQNWAQFLSALLPDDCAPTLIKSVEWRSLPAWMSCRYGPTFLADNVKVELSLYLSKTDLPKADQLSCMAAILLMDVEGEGEMQFVNSLRQIYVQMNHCKKLYL